MTSAVTFLDTPGTLANTNEPMDFTCTRAVLSVSVLYQPSGKADLAYYVDNAGVGHFTAGYSSSTVNGAGTAFTLRRSARWPSSFDLLVEPGPEAVEVEPEPTVGLPAALPTVLTYDPLYGSNTILLRGNGTNGSTVIADQLGSPWTITGTGVTVSTTTPKYGSGSLLFGGAGYAKATIAAAMGTGDFTIEAWIRIGSLASDGEILCISNPSMVVSTFDLVLEYKTTGALRGSIQNGAGTANVDITSSAGLLAINTWYHIAFTAEGATARLRIDGVVVATGAITGGRAQGQTAVRVGYLTNDLGGAVTRYFNGRIDDLRVTKGVCRYAGAGAITPPTELPSAPAPVVVSSFSMPTSNDSQSCTTDGTHVWLTSSNVIYKYTLAGALVTSRNVSGDAPVAKVQVNGLHHRAGKLYVSAANIVGAVGTSYVVEYDPDTLAYQTHRTLPGDMFSEGITYRDGFWWIAFHANMEVRQYDASWGLVGIHTLRASVTGSSGGYGPGTGYESVAWVGNYLWCNIHEIYNEDALDVYCWNGYVMLYICRQFRSATLASQGVCVDPTDPTVAWLTTRNPSGADGVVKAMVSP